MHEAAKVLDFAGDTGESELRSWLRAQVHQGVTVSTLAAELGFSRSLVSQFMSGSKPASEKLLRSICELRDKVSAAKGADSGGEWASDAVDAGIMSGGSELFETEDLVQVLGLCSMCQADGEIGIITGPPGAGKTTALKEFCDREPFTVYIRADVTMSGKELIKELGEALGVSIQGSQRNRVRQIIKRLRDSSAMIIIDESDLLVSKDSVKKLEILRAIWDETQCGLVLAGLPRLAVYLVKGPGGNENLSQFYSRVRRAYAMKGIRPDEVRRVLAGYDMTDAAKKYLAAAAASKAQGGLRRFNRLVQNSLDLVEAGETITLEIVKEADAMLVSPATLGVGY